ncbi:hypothetical protein [Solitalea lacus]|uniref:hypothetical protein n=1 Tax=Solitalea lacus TaxID=2911172 RepID=UPI001EDBC2B8|nr:hypothetical protein [Solitalea lacus]UKJ08449.1 hypothetical protein L2B55_04595 [Solitalea lacus]
MKRIVILSFLAGGLLFSATAFVRPNRVLKDTSLLKKSDSLRVKLDPSNGIDTAKDIRICAPSKGSLLSSPLFILDGKEISQVEIKNLSPNKVESFKVLKDEEARKLYGDKGKNGVIVITSKCNF